jgi:hypothetical protein
MAWFNKKAENSAQSDSGERYKGKPLLILLENYILECVGHFPMERETLMISVVQKAFGGGPDWKLTLRSTLQLGNSLDEELRQMWASNQEKARRSGLTLEPEEFARMLADRNFAHLV